MLYLFWETKENPKVKKKIEEALLSLEKRILRSSFFGSIEEKNVAVIFCNAERIRTVNREYRKKNVSTDVLSFAETDSSANNPQLKDEKSLGEIFINYEWVTTGKKAKNSDLAGLPELFIHGFLHLLGFDHEKDSGEMREMEERLKGND